MSSEITGELRYPMSALLPDMSRAGLGLLATALMLAHLPLDSVAFAAFTVLGMTFACFGLLTAWRGRLRIRVSPEAVFVNPGAKCLERGRLSGFRLDYYSTRRDREGGWMQLTLIDVNGVRVQVDSRLDGFHGFVASSLLCAKSNQLDLSPATLANLSAMGLASSEGGDPGS
ncbi:MAG: hypothetical protein GKR94_33245 [Gammaproteobacteria bacterium]|nr:hypothetical protein [Gammaproteobacteria bacterium]